MTASEDEREDTTTVDGHAASVRQIPDSADSPDNGDEPVDGTDQDTVDDGEESGKAKAKPKKKTPFWLELIILVVIAVVLTFLIQTFVARVFSIPSQSMEQTLQRLSRLHRRPHPGRQADLRLLRSLARRRDRLQGPTRLGPERVRGTELQQPGRAVVPRTRLVRRHRRTARVRPGQAGHRGRRRDRVLLRRQQPHRDQRQADRRALRLLPARHGQPAGPVAA